MTTFKFEPKGRGLEEDEEISSTTSSNIPNIKLNPKMSDIDTYIVSIENYGEGWIIVRLNNNKLIKKSKGTISWRYNNPGNLKYGPFAKQHGAIGSADGGHSVFPNLSVGKNAMKSLLFGNDRGYNKLTLDDAIHKYAPSSDGNDPNTYVNYIVRNTKISKNVRLNTLSSEQQDRMIDVMIIMEGYKQGIVTEV